MRHWIHSNEFISGEIAGYSIALLVYVFPKWLQKNFMRRPKEEK